MTQLCTTASALGASYGLKLHNIMPVHCVHWMPWCSCVPKLIQMTYGFFVVGGNMKCFDSFMYNPSPLLLNSLPECCAKALIHAFLTIPWALGGIGAEPPKQLLPS
jgi:hypothetical protein